MDRKAGTLLRRPSFISGGLELDPPRLEESGALPRAANIDAVAGAKIPDVVASANVHVSKIDAHQPAARIVDQLDVAEAPVDVAHDAVQPTCLSGRHAVVIRIRR